MASSPRGKHPSRAQTTASRTKHINTQRLTHLAVSVKPLSQAMCSAVRFLSVLADAVLPAVNRNLFSTPQPDAKQGTTETARDEIRLPETLARQKQEGTPCPDTGGRLYTRFAHELRDVPTRYRTKAVLMRQARPFFRITAKDGCPRPEAIISGGSNHRHYHLPHAPRERRAFTGQALAPGVCVCVEGVRTLDTRLGRGGLRTEWLTSRYTTCENAIADGSFDGKSGKPRSSTIILIDPPRVNHGSPTLRYRSSRSDTPRATGSIPACRVRRLARRAPTRVCGRIEGMENGARRGGWSSTRPAAPGGGAARTKEEANKCSSSKHKSQLSIPSWINRERIPCALV